MNDNRTCKDCPFWGQRPPQLKQGHCRVNPPTLSRDSNFGQWPLTYAEDWCSIVRPGLRVPREAASA